MARYRVDDLPDDALAAAALFHARDLPLIARLASGPSGQLLIVFAPAGHDHRGWRLAAVQGLARKLAPLRVNAVAASDAQAIGAASDYLAGAPGVTGQYWPLDAVGAFSA